MPPRICPPLASPIVVADELSFVVPPALDRARAEAVAREAILGSFFRPHDIKGASLSPTMLAHVPFWRVDVEASGFHVGLSSVTIGKEGSGTTIPIPVGGARHRDAVVLVTARRLFPYEPAMVSVPGKLAHDHGTPSLSAFHIDQEEMIPRASHPLAEGEIIEPDVSREQAEREAKDRILRSVEPSSALYSDYKPRVRSAVLVHYPLYITPYTYEGHANASGGESFFVVVSGKTGKVVGSRHPSALKALARKFRRLFAS